MLRERIFLLFAISLLLVICPVYFTGDADCQTLDFKTPSRVSLSLDTLSVADNQKNIAESHEKEKPDNNTSSELKGVSSSDGRLKELEKERGRDIMEEAINLLEESRDYWIKGDLENALDLLDQAYALLLDTNGDPDTARQKE